MPSNVNVDEREKALAALVKMRALTQSDGSVRPEDRATYQAHFDAFREHDLRAFIGVPGHRPPTSIGEASSGRYAPGDTWAMRPSPAIKPGKGDSDGVFAASRIGPRRIAT